MAAPKLLVTAACLANKALFVNGISSIAATDWQNFHIFMLPLFPAQHHTANGDAPTWTVWHQHELLVISSCHLVLSILHLLGHQRSVAGLVLLSAFGGHQSSANHSCQAWDAGMLQNIIQILPYHLMCGLMHRWHWWNPSWMHQIFVNSKSTPQSHPTNWSTLLLCWPLIVGEFNAALFTNSAW